MRVAGLRAAGGDETHRGGQGGNKGRKGGAVIPPLTPFSLTHPRTPPPLAPSTLACFPAFLFSSWISSSVEIRREELRPNSLQPGPGPPPSLKPGPGLISTSWNRSCLLSSLLSTSTAASGSRRPRDERNGGFDNDAMPHPRSAAFLRDSPPSGMRGACRRPWRAM